MRVKVTELTPSQKAELDALMDLSDEEIDTNDIPEVLEWRNPRRGLFAGSPSRKAEPNKRLELSWESGNISPVEEDLPEQGDGDQVDKAQRQHALKFIRELGLTSGQYEKKDHSGGYRLYISSNSKRLPRFGYVRLNQRGPDAGKLVVYANGDFSDPEGRFTAQPKNPKDAWYKFWPDDEYAMHYAAKVVRSAYESKA
jgi:hypothetical protein